MVATNSRGLLYLPAIDASADRRKTWKSDFLGWGSDFWDLPAVRFIDCLYEIYIRASVRSGGTYLHIKAIVGSFHFYDRSCDYGNSSINSSHETFDIIKAK